MAKSASSDQSLGPWMRASLVEWTRRRWSRPRRTVAATEGWFTVNVSDAAWVHNEHLADACIFEGDAAPFGQIGYTLGVLQPGSRTACTTARATRRTSSCSRASAC